MSTIASRVALPRLSIRGLTTWQVSLLWASLEISLALAAAAVVDKWGSKGSWSEKIAWKPRTNQKGEQLPGEVR